MRSDDLLRRSHAPIGICAQTRLCSKKRAMTREGVDLDMKLRFGGSTLSFHDYSFAKRCIFMLEDFSKSRRQFHVKINPFPCYCALFATKSSLRANASGLIGDAPVI